MGLRSFFLTLHGLLLRFEICHLPSRPTAVPKALEVFDLSKSNWSDRMTAAQLENALARLGSDLVPTRGKEEALPLAVPAKDIKRFGEFISDELSRRRNTDAGSAPR